MELRNKNSKNHRKKPKRERLKKRELDQVREVEESNRLLSANAEPRQDQIANFSDAVKRVNERSAPEECSGKPNLLDLRSIESSSRAQQMVLKK